MSDVSIIIRCYNEEQHIGRLLSGIMQQTVQDIEIIIVDSGSTDATVPIASRYPVKILSITPEEFTFGRALNLGSSVAQGEFIVIVSAHVYPVFDDWLEQLLRPFDVPNVVLVYGKQRGGETTKYSEHQVFAKWFPDHSVAKQGHPFCNNANAAIRRSIWEQLHYDEALTGLEDLDWTKRVMALGYSIAYSAEAEVIHLHDEVPRQTYNRYRREAIAHKKIFPEQKFSLLDFALTFCGNVVKDYWQALHNRQFFRNWLDIPCFRLMQFWGTYRGFSQREEVTKELKRRFYYPKRALDSRKTEPEARRERRIEYTKLRGKGPDDQDH
jgi:glycosyltransferase involved in cell wall biosynthesis